MEKHKWSDITRENVEQAIEQFVKQPENKANPCFYYLVYNGKQLPAKHIRKMAYEIAFGETIDNADYHGGQETANFFSRLGFTVKKWTSKKYSVFTAVWIATALLSYEQYRLNPFVTPKEMFFKQSDIRTTAQDLTAGTVQNARISSWTCADKPESRYHYLRSSVVDNASLRRLSMIDEFDSKTYPNGLNMDDILTIGSFSLTMGDLFHFVKEQYPKIIKATNYFPSLEEYDPQITVEQWIALLQDSTVTHQNYFRMLKMILEQGGESTCSHLAETYGGTAAAYSNWGFFFGKRVYQATNCPLYTAEERTRFYTIPFIGRYLIENGNKHYSWKLREQLKEALTQMNTASHHNIEFDKNMILYGPPGTGKTYSTAIYAVAICDKIALDKVKTWNYDKVMSRYRALLKENRIAFTTFHQSYGYEEFIEGIKPVMQSDDDTASNSVAYEIQSGVFKAFCERAGLPPANASNNLLAGINDRPSIWKVSLGGTGINPTRTECLQNNHIRIGYDSYGEEISDQTDFSEQGGKTVLNAFINRMQIGDIVLSCFSSTTIDAVGIVTGEYEWHDEYPEYKRLRQVKWVVKEIDENIVAINGNKTMTLPTVYWLSSIEVADVYQIVEKYPSANANLTSSTPAANNENYVFIIDEINRGNISKILGELITLIEPTKRKGQPEELQVTLPYSNKLFGVPSNVYLLGTMNTADRSIALMDTALRRRFQFVEMLPDADVLRKIGANQVDDLDVAEMLETINQRITYLYDREHTIGHAFFTRLAQSPTVETLASIFEKSVLPLLQEYFYEDYQKIQLVLGDNGKQDNQYKFVVDKQLQDSIFKGNAGDIVFDLPEKTYFINKQAFYQLESYKQIL